jgi:hypothetical protein
LLVNKPTSTHVFIFFTHPAKPVIRRKIQVLLCIDTVAITRKPSC